MSVITPTTVTESDTRDHRGSWIPTFGMIRTRFMEIRKRRGLMVALIVVNIGIPVIFLAVRLVMHAVAPKTYGPAGGYDIFTNLTAGIMFIFGFIVAAAVGCTAGSVDLSEGMFRHLVITGRSRVALYLARIPAAMAIVISMIAVGFTIVCAVCCFAAPTQLNYQGINIPAGMTQSGFDHWAVDHSTRVVCQLPSRNIPYNIPCKFSRATGGFVPGADTLSASQRAKVDAIALEIAKQNYPSYSQQFLKPPVPLMIKAGLWIELEAIIGLVVGLGLSSLLGQRTVAVILMVALELVLTPIFANTAISHLVNLQRGVVGIAMAHIEPHGLPQVFGNNDGPFNARTFPFSESTTTSVLVIIGWLVVWTGLGAWRMAKRDA